jgi:hypothetical protein
MMRHRRHNLRIRLPELSAREAAALSYFIDQIDNALWTAYGPDITALSSGIRTCTCSRPTAARRRTAPGSRCRSGTLRC